MAESWAGGLNTGLFKGFQIGSMLEEGKARKEASKAREEKDKLAKRQEKRQILTSEMNQIVQVLKSKLWKEFDPYQKKNIYDKYKELMGKFMPGYTLPDLDATKFGEGAAAAVRQAMTDGFATINSKKTTEEKQLDMMGHWQKLINNPEAWAMLEGSFNKSEAEKVARKEGQFNADVEILKQERQGKIDASDDRVKAALRRGSDNAEYGVKVANAVTVELGKETPPQTGVPSAKDFTLGSLDKYGETGKFKDLVRVPEKEKLEPGDEKHKTLMDPNFGVDLKKSLGILRLIRSGETKDKKGNPLLTEREVRDRLIKLYPPIHKDIDDMLREDGSGEMTLTVGGKTFKLK